MNGVSDTARSAWKRNGWGRRITAVSAIVVTISTVAAGIIWFVDRNAWRGDILRVAHAAESATVALKEAQAAKQLDQEIRFNEMRRQNIDSQLREMAAREKAGFTFDGDRLIRESLKDERRELIHDHAELRRLKTTGAP